MVFCDYIANPGYIEPDSVCCDCKCAKEADNGT